MNYVDRIIGLFLTRSTLFALLVLVTLVCSTTFAGTAMVSSSGINCSDTSGALGSNAYDIQKNFPDPQLTSGAPNTAGMSRQDAANATASWSESLRDTYGKYQQQAMEAKTAMDNKSADIGRRITDLNADQAKYGADFPAASQQELNALQGAKQNLDQCISKYNGTNAPIPYENSPSVDQHFGDMYTKSVAEAAQARGVANQLAANPSPPGTGLTSGPSGGSGPNAGPGSLSGSSDGDAPPDAKPKPWNGQFNLQTGSPTATTDGAAPTSTMQVNPELYRQLYDPKTGTAPASAFAGATILGPDGQVQQTYAGIKTDSSGNSYHAFTPVAGDAASDGVLDKPLAYVDKNPLDATPGTLQQVLTPAQMQADGPASASTGGGPVQTPNSFTASGFGANARSLIPIVADNSGVVPANTFSGIPQATAAGYYWCKDCGGWLKSN